jgi:ankyrin repeat protein
MSEKQKTVGVVEAKKPDMKGAFARAKPDSDLLCGKSRYEIQSELYEKVKLSDLEAVRELVAQGADINEKDCTGWTPFLSAVKEGGSGMVDLLIRLGAKDEPTMAGATAVKIAAGLELPYKLETLVTAGFAVDMPDCEGMTALMEAARTCEDNRLGGPGRVELLISKGADVNRKNKNGGTVLTFAAGFKKTEAARILLENGAIPDEKTLGRASEARMPEDVLRMMRSAIMKDWAKKEEK